MNKWYYIFIVLLILFSCEDEPIEEPSIYFGSSSVTLNVEEWSSDVRAKLSYNDPMYFNLTFDRYEGNVLRNVLHIRKIALTTNAVQVLKTDVDSCSVLCTNFNTTYIDEARDFYNVIDADQFEDWIIIDSLNNNSLEFWGRFQASFVRDDRIPKMDNYPDTLYFENGTFNGKILE